MSGGRKPQPEMTSQGSNQLRGMGRSFRQIGRSEHGSNTRQRMFDNNNAVYASRKSPEVVWIQESHWKWMKEWKLLQTPKKCSQSVLVF